MPSDTNNKSNNKHPEDVIIQNHFDELYSNMYNKLYNLEKSLNQSHA